LKENSKKSSEYNVNFDDFGDFERPLVIVPFDKMKETIYTEPRI